MQTRRNHKNKRNKNEKHAKITYSTKKRKKNNYEGDKSKLTLNHPYSEIFHFIFLIFCVKEDKVESQTLYILFIVPTELSS